MHCSKAALLCVGLMFVMVQVTICKNTNGYSADAINVSMVTKEDTTNQVLRTRNEDCDCGRGSNGCEKRADEIFCDCKPGYLQDMHGFCTECHCGIHGNCSFGNASKVSRKQCDCFMGYAEYEGICKACSCGVHGICEYDFRGIKRCICDYGYGHVSDTCTPCGCEPKYNCSFDSESRRCHCAEGFEDVRGHCEDINECLKLDVCPASSKCKNTYGSYDCICKDGFEKPSGHFNPKEDECQDIDECVKLDKPCLYEYTTCVNIPGSYRCDCKKGYEQLIITVEPNQSPKYNYCIDDSHSYRTATIAISCVFGVIIIGLSMAIYSKRKFFCPNGLQNLFRSRQEFPLT